MRAAGRLRKALPAWLGKKQICCVLAGLLLGGIAQAAGAAALRETAYRERVRSLVRRERPWLAKRLGTLGLRVVPGEANYLLFQSPVSLGEPLARRGILLRSCANYIGLDETWYRTAVRTRRQNQRLMEALEEIVK